jgi:23S rRNA pseudouridine2605 synthase
VSRLIRTAYGPFQLGSLARGAVEEVPARILAQQIGGGGTKGWAKPAKSEGHARRRR